MTQTREITIDDVVRAGRVLFGPAFAAEAAEWRDELKTTYRRRALETHPDRARSLGRAEPELLREFRAVADAYRILSALRAGPLPRGTVRPSARPQGRPWPREPPSPAAAPRTWTPRPEEPPRARAAPAGPRVRASVRPEDMPRRKLRFAEFLYYSGRVRWTDLVEAVAWQRSQRPRVGRIAVDWGFLGADDVGVILERRREAGANAIPFGEWAVRLGYLTSFQLLALLGHQLKLQRPIGQFFVERGMVEPDEVDAIRRRILRHNAGLRR